MEPYYSELPKTNVVHSIVTESAQQTKTIISCETRSNKTGIWYIAWLKNYKTFYYNILWASPLHMVKKSDGTWRPCRDNRRVNALTVPDRYPLHNIQTFHYRLVGADLFSKLDLIKAYHFIPMNAADFGKNCNMHSIWQFRVPLDAVQLALQLWKFLEISSLSAQRLWLCIIIRTWQFDIQ